jgi:hypothetical protein
MKMKAPDLFAKLLGAWTDTTLTLGAVGASGGYQRG